MKAITVGIDVFPDHDDQHACAAIRRVGAGMFRVLLPGEDIGEAGERIRHDFETIEEATEFAAGIAKFVETDPNLTSPSSNHLRALIVAKDEEVARVRAQRDDEALTARKSIEGLENELREALAMAKAQPQPQAG